MNGCRAAFAAFLDSLGLPERDRVLAGFDRYHDLLLEKNRHLNLFSRATPAEELWTKHFLDSLLPLKCVDFMGKKALDFGSGGGLPGIPLKLAVPECRLTLLDSVRKKTDALRELVEQLELAGTDVVCSRLEDYHAAGDFDLILMRAVRLEERYLKPLRRLLAPSGQLLCYKARELADIAPYGPKLLMQEEFDWGGRSLYGLRRAQLTRKQDV